MQHIIVIETKTDADRFAQTIAKKRVEMALNDLQSKLRLEIRSTEKRIVDYREMKHGMLGTAMYERYDAKQDMCFEMIGTFQRLQRLVDEIQKDLSIALPG